MRKEHTTIGTVGELKEYLKDIPDDTPIGRTTNGHYQVNKTGDVGFFLGTLPIGRDGKDGEKLILKVSA